jgi:ERF superfamily
MNEQHLTTTNQSLEIVSDPQDIVRYALERGASVDVIERMMTVRRELKAESAKEAFERALAQFQFDCPPIVKQKDGAKNAYKFAPIDVIVHITREVRKANGLSYRFDGEFTPTSATAICKVTHCDGHSETSRFTAPIDAKNPMMSDPQRAGGAMTFAQRRAYCMAFGIVTADEDLDARDEKAAKAKLPIVATVGPQRGPKSYKAQVWSEAGPKFEENPNKFEEWLKGNGLIDECSTLKDVTEIGWAKILPHVEQIEINF